MKVPDFLVALILVFDGDQIGGFGQSELKVVPETLDGSPNLVLSLAPGFLVFRYRL